MLPYLPNYTGPFKVGTIEVEIPVSELSSPASSLGFAIPTIKARLFYPCHEPAAKPTPVYWAADPQHENVAAFASFLGLSSRVSNAIAYSSWLICRVKIPAIQNAPILPSSNKEKKWPVVVFSHGLGGTSNSYSQIVGSLSSHGIVVVAPEHRDGSAPITFVRNEVGGSPTSVDYRRIAHDANPEVLNARGEQLRIRLWELGLVYDLLGRLDAGQTVTNLNKASSDLTMFNSALDIHRPGSITWVGHSFGAASIVQFIKSVYHRPARLDLETYKPLYTPHHDSELCRQITPTSVVALLDIWMLPLIHDDTRWLFDKPLPCYFNQTKTRDTSVIAILSQGFYRWHANLMRTKDMLSPKGQDKLHAPHVYYAESSAHLSQSDFGVLFPWLTRFAFKAKDPERILRLNVRGILEVMRREGREVADTADTDLEIEGQKPILVSDLDSTNPDSRTILTGQDQKILLRDGSVKGWISLDLEKEDKPGEGLNTITSEASDPIDAVIDGEVDKINNN